MLRAALPAYPAILDIEASGFGPASYPIEVGCVLADGSAFCTLIAPEPGWTHWDPEAERLHGISRALLQRHGRPAGEVARQLNEVLRGLVVFSDGWAHDYPWLAALFEAAGCVPSFRLETLRRLLSEPEAAAWQQARQAVARELAAPRHRASHDARVLQMTLKHLREPRVGAALPG